MALSEKLRYYVFAVFYLAITFQFIAWKYQTKDVYFQFLRWGKTLLIFMHVTIVLSNIFFFIFFIFLDSHPVVEIIKMFGILCFITGAVLLLSGFVSLGSKVFSPRENDYLKVDGIFSIVRHPMYLGGIIAAFGLSCLAGSMLGLVYTLILGLVLADIATAEERDLINRFGEEYIKYTQKVARLNPLLTFFKQQ